MKPHLHSLFRFNRPAVPTLRQGLDRYVDEISPTKKCGIGNDRSLARMWQATEYADWSMSKVSGPQVAAVRDAWLTRRKPSTVVRRLALLSHVYTTAQIEWGYRKLENPVKMIRKPKVRDARERRLFPGVGIPGIDGNELDWILRETRSKYGPVAFQVAAKTAMRRGEVASLDWKYVDFAARTVHLPDTKNGHHRTVPLSPSALQVLRSVHVQGATGPVFPVSAGSLTRLFSRATRRARCRYEGLCQAHGIQPNPKLFTDLRLHDLRHEAISTMAPHFHAHELAKISGHRDTRMLMRYYHPDPSELADRLAAI